jgi:hypothetical protein
MDKSAIDKSVEVEGVFSIMMKMSKRELKRVLKDMCCDELHFALEYGKHWDFDPLEQESYCFKHMWE